MPTKTEQTTTAHLGRTADGTRVYVTITLTSETLAHPVQTTEHGFTTSVTRLSVQAMGVDKGARTVSVAGQAIDLVRNVVKTNPGQWTRQYVRELADIWSAWHLNDVRAGCAHQEVIWEDHQYGRRPSLELTPACPESGYRYGSAWLYAPLPADVLARVRFLMGLPTGSVPDYV